MSTVRTIVAIEDLHLWSIDTSHPYLNGKMGLDVYMKQLEGFTQGYPNELVCLLDKALTEKNRAADNGISECTKPCLN